VIGADPIGGPFSKESKLNIRRQIMKRLALVLLGTVAFAGLATAESKISCEGILNHGSGGEYIASKNNLNCWLGADFSDAVLAVCKDGKPCKITGAATTCKKDPDPHRCQEITRLDSIGH
jgi:hypothetical protein